MKSYLDLVPEDVIRSSAENDDLDAALMPIMNLLAITEGDIASHAFSHLDGTEAEGTWTGLSLEDRLHELKNWLRIEDSYRVE